MNLKKSETIRKDLVKYIESILWLLNPNENSNLNKNHVFISYDNDDRELCLMIKNELELLEHKIWINVEDNKGDSIDVMARGIESASCVLICMTDKYKESLYCRLEAEYAMKLKKPYVPLIMQHDYKPDGWLEIFLSGKAYIDFTCFNFEENMCKLKKHLETIIQTVIIKEEASLLECKKSIYQWNDDDVNNWLLNKNITLSIKENILPCDGRLLEQLYKMSIEVPEFFYTSLRTDTKANLKDIATFATELRLLFVKK